VGNASALAKSTLAVLIFNFRTQSDCISSALNLFNEAIDIDPNLATTYNWRGLAYYSVGMLDKADRDFERCLALEPLYSACYKNFALSTLLLNGASADEVLLYGLNKDILNGQYIDLFWLAKHNKAHLFSMVVNHKGNIAGWGRVDELYQAYLQPEQNRRPLINDILAFYKRNNSSSFISLSMKNILAPIGAHELSPETDTLWSQGLAAYRQTPAFNAYIIENGIYQYWLENGFPPQCAALDKDDSECD
jgi:tetratricopeptide (TPR) repeat protein